MIGFGVGLGEVSPCGPGSIAVGSCRCPRCVTWSRASPSSCSEFVASWPQLLLSRHFLRGLVRSSVLGEYGELSLCPAGPVAVSFAPPWTMSSAPIQRRRLCHQALPSVSPAGAKWSGDLGSSLGFPYLVPRCGCCAACCEAVGLLEVFEVPSLVSAAV